MKEEIEIYIDKNPGCSANDIIESITGDDDEIKEVIKRMKKSGTISISGRARGTKYWPKGTAPDTEVKSKKLKSPKGPKPSDPIAALRASVRFFYDLQQLRISQKLRSGNELAELDDHDREFHETRGTNLNKLEKEELRHIDNLLRYFPISEWLQNQVGIGPTMAGVICSEIDIHKAEMPGALIQFCGLSGPRDGQVQKRTKGQKNNYNAWLRTRLVGVMADCMIKSNSPWRKFYDNYKNRKENTMLDCCMGCDGSGKGLKGEHKGKTCGNCKGTGGPAPWGESDGHRHRASMRYMVKMFLNELYIQWKTIEGLKVHKPYSEVYLEVKHGEHGSYGGLDANELAWFKKAIGTAA